MQTSQSPQAPVVKQREYELQQEIHHYLAAPGVRALLEFARLKAEQAHSNYLTAGPTPEGWALEKAWREVMRTIEQGPKMDQLKQQPRGA